MEFTAKIGKRGAHLAFRVPAKVVRAFDMRAGDEVDFAVENGKLIVKFRDKVRPSPTPFA